MRCLSFSEEAPDTTVFFQVILLPGQCFVWIGSGRAKVTSLVAAAATPYVRARRLPLTVLLADHRGRKIVLLVHNTMCMCLSAPDGLHYATALLQCMATRSSACAFLLISARQLCQLSLSANVLINQPPKHAPACDPFSDVICYIALISSTGFCSEHHHPHDR